MEILRKLQVEENLNWVYALPRAINAIHDQVGETGLSPYEIVFGRERPMALVPYQPPCEAEDAVAFFAKQQQVDRRVAQILNGLHAKRQERENRNRPPSKTFDLDALVWCRRPEDSGNKLDSRWIGPARVIAREAEDSYVIRMHNGEERPVHATQLKNFKEDTQTGACIPLHFHRRTEVEPDVGPEEWEVEKIEGHRYKGGVLQFLTRWKGFGKKEATWEPLKSFFHRWAAPIRPYLQHKGLLPDLVKALPPTPL
jgi:hypothetical protein